MAESTQWRVYITLNNGNASYSGVAELEMADVADGPNLCTGGTPLYSTQHGTYTASRAFDGNKAAYGWLTASGSARYPSYIGYQFASPVQIREFRIWSNEDGLAGGNDEPQDFVLQYYDDDASDWVSVDGASYTGETGWTNYEERVYAGDLSVLTKATVSGKCVRGVANLPAHREIYAYSMLDGEYRGFAETDEYGNFSVSVLGTDTVFLRIVDPEGIYSTEIRENIIPIADPVE